VAAANSWPAKAAAGAQTPTGDGLWVAHANGRVEAYYAKNYGGASGVRLNRPITGMAATPTGKGYWLVAGDGGIFGYGDAKFYGSTGNIRLNKPVFSMAPTKDGKGYWLVASDGGIFGYGDARFYGSLGAVRLNQPIIGLTTTPSGKGYWMVARDGGIFGFGDARHYGSLGGRGFHDVIGMARTPSGKGYWLLRKLGSNCTSYGFIPSIPDVILPLKHYACPTVYAFGDALVVNNSPSKSPFSNAVDLDFVNNPVAAIVSNSVTQRVIVPRANGGYDAFGPFTPGRP
jgi:hypothetical protein